MEDCEALLFSNIKNCPTISKRLGLNKVFIKHSDWVRGKVSKIAKEDETILSLAKFVVNDQNAFGNLRVSLRFVRVQQGVWMEAISKDIHLYHTMLVVTEAGKERLFYTSVVMNPRRHFYQCTTWVPASASYRATMSLP